MVRLLLLELRVVVAIGERWVTVKIIQEVL